MTISNIVDGAQGPHAEDELKSARHRNLETDVLSSSVYWSMGTGNEANLS